MILCRLAWQRAKKDHDSLSCFNPDITVHDCKLRVDGINKYLDNLSFRFDHVFSEQESTETVRYALAEE